MWERDQYFSLKSLWGAQKYLFDTHKRRTVGYPYSIWISKSLESQSLLVYSPWSLFSLCRRFSLRGTDSVDVLWSLWHTLRTPTGLSVHPSGPRPAHKTETHVSCSSDSLTSSSYLVWCNWKCRIGTSWAFDASEQVDVCARCRCVGGGVRAAPIDEAPGSTPDNKSACRLLFPPLWLRRRFNL